MAVTGGRAGGRAGGVVCAGNWIVDIVHTIDAWPGKSDLVFIRDEATGVGGGAANVALDLAAFGTGLAVIPVGLLGGDLHGHVALEACRAAGLPVDFMAHTDAAPTAHTHVMNVPGDSRTFFYHPGANDLFGAEHVPVAALAGTGARLFYLGYINLMGGLDRLDGDGGTAAARILKAAKAAGFVTVADLVSADSPDFAARVAAACPHLDVLFLNEIEAARATGQAVSGPGDRAGLARAAGVLRDLGAGTVVAHTAAMSLWLGPGGMVAGAPEPVDPADIVSPVGAGDAFAAGVILGLHEGWAPETCLTLGHRAAAACLKGATATGSIPPLAVLMAGAA
jgi:sugar/nucleoside kinase (ribokinase family)